MRRGLHKGEAMLELATSVLQAAHDTLPGGDDEDRWNEFSAVFVTNLVRRALFQLRNSQVTTQLSIGVFNTIGPLGPCPPMNCEKFRIWLKHTTLEKLPQWRITKIVATRLQMLRLKCTKFDFGRDCAPDLTLQRSPDPLAGFKGYYF